MRDYLTRPRMLLLVTAAVAALTSACGGSGSAGTAANDNANIPTSTPTSAGAAAVPSASSGGAAASAAGSSKPTSAMSAAAGASSPAAPASTAPAAAQPTGSAVPLPPPGTYKYHATGSSSSFFGNQQINDTATLTVNKLSSSSEHTKQSDSSGSTEQVLVSKSDGLYLSEVHLSQPGFDEDFKPAGSALLFPAKPKQGQQWHWTMKSTDGKYTLQGHLTLANLHSSTTEADGTRVATVAVRSVLHITGNNFDITVHQRDDSGHDAVIVREHAVTDGTAYGTKVQSDVTSALSSRPS